MNRKYQISASVMHSDSARLAGVAVNADMMMGMMMRSRRNRV